MNYKTIFPNGICVSLSLYKKKVSCGGGGGGGEIWPLGLAGPGFEPRLTTYE